MREEETKLAKLRKSCTVTSKIINAFRIMVTVGAICCAIAAIGIGIFHERIDSQITKDDFISQKSIYNSISSEFTLMSRMNFDFDDYIEKEEYSAIFASFCACGAVICIITAVLFSLLRRIFKTMADSSSPFNDEALTRLKKVFIGLIVFTVLCGSVGTAIVVGLVCLCTYRLIDYGVTLQNQFDETV